MNIKNDDDIQQLYVYLYYDECMSYLLTSCNLYYHAVCNSYIIYHFNPEL